MQWHAAPLSCPAPSTQCLKSKLTLGKLPKEGTQWQVDPPLSRASNTMPEKQTWTDQTINRRHALLDATLLCCRTVMKVLASILNVLACTKLYANMLELNLLTHLRLRLPQIGQKQYVTFPQTKTNDILSQTEGTLCQDPTD